MSIKAYSYVRFSTPEQEKGDSEQRQIALSQAYVKENKDIGLVLDDTLKMTDKGVSAFKGKNVDKGRLGVFLQAVETGKVKKGSYLLIENFDRLSRVREADALRLFLDILKMGVIIVTLSDNKKYDDSTLGITELIISLTVMARAHEESAQKGKRIKSSWDNKKKNILQKKLTMWSPMWLNLSEDRTEFLVNEERADIVKQIFEWSFSGLGTTLIIKRLEENGVKPWDLGKIKRKKRLAKHWHSSLIQRFFTDRTVLGEYKLRKSKAKGDYEIIKGYYPQIIEDDLFYRAKEARESRNVSNKGGGRKGKYVSNLFAKLAICGYSVNWQDSDNHYGCAGGGFGGGNDVAMVYVNKGKKYPIKYLQCSRIKNGNTGCEDCSKMWRYDYFEKTFLTHVKDIDVSVLVGSPDILNKEIEEIEKNIAVANGMLIHNKDRQKGFKASLKKYTDLPNIVIEEAYELEREEANLKSRIELSKQELKSKQYEVNNSDHTKEQLSSLIDAMSEKEGGELFDLRLRLSELLKHVIARIDVYAKGKIWTKRREDIYLSKYSEKINKKYEKETEIEKIKFKETMKRPYYIITYKSGEKRTMIFDHKDQSILLYSDKVDKNDGLIDMYERGVSEELERMRGQV